MNRNRRRLLQAGGAFAAMSAVAGLGRPASARESRLEPAVKRIGLLNLHTGEEKELVFSRGGAYVPQSLAAIDVLLRDFRTGEQHVIDPNLLDILYDVARNLGVDPAFSVISGYRSPRTNEKLRERGDGVARHSLHMEGRAIDVRVARMDCAVLAQRARAMGLGGVGYYRHSDFVHLDTGAFRTWNG